MNKIVFVLVLSLSTVSSFAASLVKCEGVTNPDHELTLVVKNVKLVQVRVQPLGSLPRGLMINFITTNYHSSFYSIEGSHEILEIQNSVLRLEGGSLRIAGERFDCFEN